MSTRIYNQNFSSDTVASSITSSSEQSAFPLTNVFNEQRRSKVWRSNGFWEVTSSNNTFVFRETIAVDLTATVSILEYSSTTLFLAGVKTALEATGASTYTVTQDVSTRKIKITSNGAGGGGIFELIWTDGSSAGFAGITGFETGSDDTGALTYLADELKVHTSEWIKWDFGISTNPQAFALITQRNVPIQISPTATITLQSNETDIWTGPSFEQVITNDDEVMSVVKATIDDGLADEARRFWRLNIVDVSNPNGFVEIGFIFLGDFFEPTRGQVQIPFSAAFVDRSTTIFSEEGQTFSDEREKAETFNLQWFGFTITEKETFEEFFLDFGTSIPFFVQIDPNSAIGSTSTKYLRYVKMISAPSYSVPFPGVFSLSMPVREEL